jgi:hypothetical protein
MEYDDDDLAIIIFHLAHSAIEARRNKRTYVLFGISSDFLVVLCSSCYFFTYEVRSYAYSLLVTRRVSLIFIFIRSKLIETHQNRLSSVQ